MTQSAIIAAENAIVAAAHAASEAKEGAALERKTQGSGLYDANRNCWSTLALNARELRRRIDALLAELQV